MKCEICGVVPISGFWESRSGKWVCSTCKTEECERLGEEVRASAGVPVEDIKQAQGTCDNCGIGNNPATLWRSGAGEKLLCRRCNGEKARKYMDSINMAAAERIKQTPGVLISCAKCNEFHPSGSECKCQEPSVNHPPHYTTGKIEVIDFVEDQKFDYHVGNVVKYLCRAPHKGKELEDLKKAKWYLDRYIKTKTGVVNGD